MVLVFDESDEHDEDRACEMESVSKMDVEDTGEDGDCICKLDVEFEETDENAELGWSMLNALRIIGETDMMTYL